MEKRPSMAEEVLAELREDILSCRYGEGELLTEAEISGRFGVSKTPAREALNHLCIEGLLEKIPHTGYLIRGLSVEEIQNLFQFRYILETAVVELAVKYASDEEIAGVEEIASMRLPEQDEDIFCKYNALNTRFHVALAELTKNPYLVSTLTGVLNQLRRALTMDLMHTDVNDLLRCHNTIVDAVRARDLERARACVQREIVQAEERTHQRKSLRL